MTAVPYTRDQLAQKNDWDLMALAHQSLEPVETAYRIAFHPPGQPNAPVAILAPTPRMMAQLMHGHLTRRRRVVGANPDTSPIFEGDGELLPPMSEREAVEHLAWMCLPPGTNHWRIITVRDLPATRDFRDAWEMSDA